MVYEAHYAMQMVRDRQHFQQLGLASIEQGMEAIHAAQLIDRLGARIGNYALFTAATYDMAHVGRPTSVENRDAAAINGLALAGFLELVDDTIDTPYPGRTRKHEDDFLQMNIDEFLDGESILSVPDQFMHGRIDACRAIAKYCRTRLRPDFANRREQFGAIANQLIAANTAQHQTFDPEELLTISMNVFGPCMELEVLPCEFADNAKYPDIRQAAWWYGAMCGVLDHGSEILVDIAESSMTYATALLMQQGVSAATLSQISTMRKDAARDCYQKGLDQLETKEQRAIFRVTALAVVANSMKKRVKDLATPRSIELAMVNAPQRLVTA